MTRWTRNNKRDLAALITPLRSQGLTNSQIGLIIGKSRETVRRICHAFGIKKCAFVPDIDLDKLA